MDASGNGTPILSNRDLILEIRNDVKELKQVAAELQPLVGIAADHENRIRGLEDSTAKWKYGIPPALLTSIGALVAALFGVRAN